MKPILYLLSLTAAHAAPLKLPPTLPSTSGYQLEDAFGGALEFKQPVAIAGVPGEKDRLIIVEKTGKLIAITGYPEKPVKSEFFDLPAALANKGRGTLATSSECGLLGVAFHPRFAENGWFYVAYDLTVREGGKDLLFDCVSRFSVSKTDPSKADPTSEVPLISQLDPTQNHNGGDLQFGPDGFLYTCIGDGGGHYDPFNNARVIDKDFFACIYRLDVDLKPDSLAPNLHSQKSTTIPSAVGEGGYKVPPNNPFLGTTLHNGKPVDPQKLRTEIYACGMRNPWRMAFDPKDGRLFCGVVGEDAWEQVNLVKAGDNFGWSYYEGSHAGPNIKSAPVGITFAKPIYEYPHGNDTLYSGNSVSGGVVSRGSRLPELDGAYIFGDYISHCVWCIRDDGARWVPELLARSGAVSGFGTDPANGDVLVADIDRGRIQRLTRAPKSEVPPPALLSLTGAFADLKSLEPAPGVIAYNVNHSAWNGGLTARRWFSLPGTEKIGFNQHSNWYFPTGSVWIQQLDDANRKLETRFLIKTETAVYGISYKWRADQSEADLVPDEGIPASGNEPHFPGRSECLMCHTSIAGYTLGMNTWQLNGPAPQIPATNQLTALAAAGHLNAVDLTGAPTFAALADTSRSLDDRSRAYLAVNCSPCHQQDGVASSPWATKASLTTAQTRIVDGKLNIDFGDPANRVIAPGDLTHSMILKRLKADGVPRMPMGSVGPFDQAGIDLISAWIQSLAPAK